MCAAAFLIIGFLLLTPSAQTVTQENPLPTGIVIDAIVCRSQPNQSYALFLPPEYTPAKKWPVLFAFDPAARGKIPVALFQDAAAKYGYIVAGSNNSRNGVATDDAVSAMLRDVDARFPIDERRVYATGFSGGARVACSVATTLKGSIAGVIACSGGFPPDIKPSKSTPFILFGVAGTDDFNFVEMQALHKTLDSLEITNEIEIFNGGHNWPPPASCTRAIEWMELKAMVAGRRPKDELLIDELLRVRSDSARSAEEAGDLFEAYLRYESITDTFKGLRDTGEFETKVNQLAALKEVRSVLSRNKDDERQQRELEGELIGLIRGTHDSEDRLVMRTLLDTKISTLKRKTEAQIDNSDRRVARRVVEGTFVRLIEEASALYTRRQFDHMAVDLELAAAIKPETPRVLYNLAVAYALIGKKKQALSVLEKAIHNGFSDIEKLKQDPDLSSIREEGVFKRIIESFSSPKSAP